MKLIFLYGPPAAGKLTIGTILAQQTGYRLFHNHLTVMVGRTIFENPHEPHPDRGYRQLLKQLRLDCIRAAAQENINLIFTLAYSGAIDDPFIQNTVDAVESAGGEVCFVQLTAPDEILLQRVNSSSRQALDKLTSPDVLRQVLEQRDMRGVVKYPHILQLDTSQTAAFQAASRVITFFDLPDKN